MEKIKTFLKAKKGRVVFAVALLAVLGVLVNRARSVVLVASVNGQLINRLELIKELEKQAGRTVLSSMVERMLFYQEAKKRGITIPSQDIDNEIAKFESDLQTQGQSLDQLLAVQGWTRNQLEDEVELQKIIEKLLEENLKVSDEEIESYLADNADSFSEEMSDEEKRQTAEERLQSQKFSEELDKLLTSLREEADINYFIEY
jgi:foldase protein PrsA